MPRRPTLASVDAPGRVAPGASAALNRTITYRLHTLSKLTDRVSAAAYLAGAGIGLAEGRCLAAVGTFSPLSVNALALRANLDKGQASRAAQALVDRGLVRKDGSAVDGRGVVLTLTAAGEAAWRRVIAVVEQRNRDIAACLDEREQRQLDRLLDRLLAAARAAAGAPSPDDETA